MENEFTLMNNYDKNANFYISHHCFSHDKYSYEWNW